MKQAVVGLLAHVDAGKTTLAEAMLYLSGAVRKAGRVDRGDAHLDFERVERERGITVFSKQAVLDWEDTRLMLLDAPGHVDFCAEAERIMPVLDVAVVVIGANDGIQGHTRTLWHLLDRYGIPTVVFANKMDLAGADRETVLVGMRQALGEGCLDADSLGDASGQEAAAMLDDEALDEFLESEELSAQTLARLVSERKVFPVVFGSALRMEGVTDLLDLVCRTLPKHSWPAEFGARVYKISHGNQGERIAWIKVTGGTLKAKQVIEGALRSGEAWSDKIDQLRQYNCDKFEVVSEVSAGGLCAATGLSHVAPGDVLGTGSETLQPALAPVMDFGVVPQGCDAHAVLRALRVLDDEDPLLGVSWNEEAQEVRVCLMGTVQQEVVQQDLAERFGLDVSFGAGAIVYKETLATPVEGVGHFEPLRHYAEVHLLVEPLERGSGVVVGTRCSTDDLDLNWQRLILTHVLEREHKGVLTGAALTDVRITLLAGRAHAKHTEGGDFRQATYRAIRQALMQAQSVLLEPWYNFSLEVPQTSVGRALADLQRMSATFEMPQNQADMALIQGHVPAAEVGDYPLQVAAYTHGLGSIQLELAGYEPCHNERDVVEAAAYDARADLANTPDSVFCSHGAGYTVPWDEVPQKAHVQVDSRKLRPWREADASFFSTRV